MSVAQAVALRQVFCVTDHTRRDLAAAEAVCQGRFEHAGVSRNLGLEPDWLDADPPADPEWGIEWRKFYCGLDLGHAFQVTGERRFLDAWERLVASFIVQVAPANDRSDVIGRRVLNWIYAWQRFASTATFDGLRPGLSDAIEASLAAQLDHLETHLTPERNHRTFELYALFVAALGLPSLDPDGRRLAFAVRELNANLAKDVRTDGVHRESSTHYHHVALRTYLGVRENARRFAVSLPDSFDARLTRACEFAMHCHRPDGGIPMLSDSDSGSYLDLLELASSLLHRADFAYVASRGKRGTPPANCNVSFPDGGYHVQRSGWGNSSTQFEHERYLIFDCGPLGDGSHGHYDALSVEVAAGGAPLIVDPGRYTYVDSNGWRHWFKGTAAHNTVTVDGLDQTPYRAGATKGQVANARLVERRTSPDGLDELRGEVRSPCYEVVHERRVIFVGEEYWIIEDRLESERPHRFDLRFHLAPSADGRTILSEAEHCATLLAPGLALLVTGGQPAVEGGWVSPLYGHKMRAPVLSVVVEGAATAFVSLVAPLADDSAPPRMQVRRRYGITTVAVAGLAGDGAARDVVSWGGARTSWVRLSPNGQQLRSARCP